MRALFAGALVMVMWFATTARADSTTLFPLSGSLGKDLRDAPEELTRVLAKSRVAEIASVPIEDAATLMECDLAAEECLASITRSVGAATIMFGKVERRGERVMIKLTQFGAGGEHDERIMIDGDTTEKLAASLARRLDPEPEPPKKKPAPSIIEKEPAPVRESAGGVTGGTWGLVIGGGVMVAGGAVVFASANRLRDDAKGAPTQTREDIDRLLAIEKAGRLRSQVGGALMIAGGVVTTIGIVRAIVQKSKPRERPLIDLVPEAGGASILFTTEWK